MFWLNYLSRPLWLIEFSYGLISSDNTARVWKLYTFSIHSSFAMWLYYVYYNLRENCWFQIREWIKGRPSSEQFRIHPIASSVLPFEPHNLLWTFLILWALMVMGPDIFYYSRLPSHLRAMGDIKTVLWTDGEQNLQEFSTAEKMTGVGSMTKWINCNKIPENLRELFLQSHLFGLVHNLCSGISKNKIEWKFAPRFSLMQFINVAFFPSSSRLKNT